MGLTRGQKECRTEFDVWWKKRSKQTFEYGGPAGSGKSWISNLLLEDTGLDLERVAIITYTGRAAYNLLKKGLNACTAHRLLYKPIIKLKPEYAQDGKTQRVDAKGEGIFHKVLEWVKNDPADIIKQYDLIYIDEGYMVDEEVANDIVKLGLPILVSGDINQLGPVNGRPYFLSNPDYLLNEVTRQALGDPITVMALDILKHGYPTKKIYGPKAKVFEFNGEVEYSPVFEKVATKADIIITCTNKLRQQVNDVYRTNFLGFGEEPCINDKVVCRQNNWNESVDGIPLINGLVGYIRNEIIELDRNTFRIDFEEEDFPNSLFSELMIDKKYLSALSSVKQSRKINGKKVNLFQYAYALTTHLVQGSEYDKAIFLDDAYGDAQNQKRLRYTAVTRAKKNLLYFT